MANRRAAGFIVGCSLADPVLCHGAKEVVGSCGGRMVCLPSDRVAQRAVLLDALISDASPWDDRLLADVRAWRAENPHLPILFVLPPTPLAVGFAPRLAGLPAVQLHIGQGDASVDDGLGVQLERLIRSIPAHAVLRLVRSVFPHAPAELDGVTASAVTSLAAGSRVTVGVVAGALDQPGWWLERFVAKHGLPRPKELLDWITLLHVAVCSDRFGRSVFETAAAAGLDRVAFRRLRGRRGIEHETLVGGTEALPVADVLAAFRARCSPASAHAESPTAGRSGRKRKTDVGTF
jgi:hypothetical protein